MAPVVNHFVTSISFSKSSSNLENIQTEHFIIALAWNTVKWIRYHKFIFIWILGDLDFCGHFFVCKY